MHVILPFDDGCKKVFSNVIITGFKKKKNLKAHLLRSQLVDSDEWACLNCVYENLQDTCSFKS